MKRFSFPDSDNIVLTDVLYALSDQTRLWIVALLDKGGDQCCGEVGLVSVPKSTLAHHFKVLRETGVIATRTEGTYSVNSVRRADLDSRFPGLLDAVLHSLPPCPVTNPHLSKEKALPHPVPS